MSRTCLNDIVLFNFENYEWAAVTQMGFIPDKRWNAALAYSEDTQQLFIFGGSNYRGACRNEVFCCEMNPRSVFSKEREYREALKEVNRIVNAEYAVSKKDSK